MIPTWLRILLYCFGGAYICFIVWLGWMMLNHLIEFLDDSQKEDKNE